MKQKTVSPAGSRTAPWLVLAAAAGLLDQAAKDTVERMGDDQFPQEPECLKGRVKLHKNHNDGLPFGALRQYPELVRQVPLAAFWAAFGVFAWLAPKRGHLAEKAGLALVLVYALAPLTDRALAAIPPELGPPALIVLGCDGAVSCLALRRAGTTDVLRWYR